MKYHSLYFWRQHAKGAASRQAAGLWLSFYDKAVSQISFFADTIGLCQNIDEEAQALSRKDRVFCDIYSELWPVF
jgi:hypothetical protein